MGARNNYTPGDTFGKTGTDANHSEPYFEFGFIFGKNIDREIAEPLHQLAERWKAESPSELCCCRVR